MVSEWVMNTRSRLMLMVWGILSFTLAGFLVSQEKYLLSFLLMILGFTAVLLLMRIFDAITIATASFFESLRNDDTTVHFPVNQSNKTLARLYSSMNLLKDHFQEIKLKNEYNEAFYKTLIQNSSAGLLVLNENNHIELINRIACNYAGISTDSTNPDILRIKHPAFFEAVCNLKSGENMTYRNIFSDNMQMLSFRATMIRRQDMTLKLVSIQDIRNELEARELESYRKLMSVMTHEIMNLLTPLTTVARELFSLFDRPDSQTEVSEIDEGTIRTTITGLKLIDEQSNGLMDFVNNYRKISKLPQPEFTNFDTQEWIEQLKIAFSGKMKKNDIAFSVTADKSLKQIIADRKLLNQAMINLINNSIDAVLEITEKRKIEIQLIKSPLNKVIIKVINNGPAIPSGLQEKIFVPFFTTKKNGSGIGLSISQEILKLHNGSIVVVPAEEKQTCFMIEF